MYKSRYSDLSWVALQRGIAGGDDHHSYSQVTRTNVQSLTLTYLHPRESSSGQREQTAKLRPTKVLTPPESRALLSTYQWGPRRDGCSFSLFIFFFGFSEEIGRCL